ncbi:MAG TPA: ComEC/Rec2 family competence protein, partial [Marmoricola sp.]|nr:ComEC/Rec2 family competence protein [Marmoricola sp.]
PALVDGDDAGLDTRTVAEFRASGLTHLTAVSGANLTLACGALLLLARWLGVRRHGLTAVAVLGILGFVVLARGEPSVVRAAAMGGAALIGLGRNGQGRGMRAWGIAVSGLVLFDPYLGVNLGFALPPTATACILWLAPGWRDALCGWLPRWAAEAIAVPIAAQLGCTPLVAAISGQVSLVAVAANLLAAPVVAPATVLGLLAGVITLASATLGAVVARPALWCCEWLLFVAHRAAGLPTATLDWPTHPVSLAALTIGCLITAMLTPILLRRPALSLLGTALLLVVICVRIPTPGWPPKGWVLVACDVGQGDGLVLNLGSGQAVVVDTGPDPDLINQCLSRLGIREIPLLILTHFHQDHVGGLDGVLRGRRVGGIEVSTLASPLAQVRRVQAAAGRRGIPVIRAQLGEVRRMAGFTWQVLNPPAEAYPESESPPNDASIVMLAQVKHIRILFTGDVEPPAQAQLRRILAGHRVEVLKVAHHGSARQDQELIRGLRPSLALISVGTDNDYGHPAAATLELLHQSGSLIRRTDQQGDIAVLVTSDGSLSVTSRGSPRHGLS